MIGEYWLPYRDIGLDAKPPFDRYSVRNLACIQAGPEVARTLDWSHCIAFLLRCMGCVSLFENELEQRSSESDGSGRGRTEAEPRGYGAGHELKGSDIDARGVDP